MNYIGKFISNFKEFYNEINSATLTGAIDVIVVRQPDGSYTSSPFHVRFGKMGVLRSKEKIVDIEINGEPVDIHMKLGDTGEAFFVEEVENPNETPTVPSHLATSPIPNDSGLDYIGEELEKMRLEDQCDEEQKLLVNHDDFSSGKLRNLSLSNRNTLETSIVTDVSTNFGYNPEPSHESLSESSSEILVENRESCVILSSSPNQRCAASLSADEPTIGQDTHLPQLFASTHSLDLRSTSNSAKKRRRKKSSVKKPFTKARDEPHAIRYNCLSAAKNEEMFLMDEDNNVSGHQNNQKEKLEMAEKLPDCERSSNLPRSASEPNSGLNILSSGTHKLSATLNDIYPYSDGEVNDDCSGVKKRLSSPLSDTEYENSRHDPPLPSNADHIEWTWGEFPRSNTPSSHVTNKSVNMNQSTSSTSSNSSERDRYDSFSNTESRRILGVLSFIKSSDSKNNPSNNEEGVFLDDLNRMDPEKADLYLSSGKSGYKGKRSSMDDYESGNGSLSQSPPITTSGPLSQDSDSDHEKSLHRRGASFMRRILSNLALSTCGGLEDECISNERFEQSFVSYDDFCANPVEILQNPSLVVRIDSKFYNWTTAAPVIMSLVLYNRGLPDQGMENLLDKFMPKKQQKEARSYWWSWGRSAHANKLDAGSNMNPHAVGDNTFEGFNEVNSNSGTGSVFPTVDESVSLTRLSSSNVQDINILPSSEMDDCKSIVIKKVDFKMGHKRKNSFVQYKKVLRISSKQIEGLNLVTGRNEVVFSVTTAYQGTTRCKCHIYLWNHDDKIIVSDIDGTITKSDILGHILPVIGKDWAQSGVANLFNKIHDNGYKLLYLSARAIGQARITRDYLKSVRQGDLCLPDGPLLLSPTSLISAFHREVIEKKPEEFKIKCLKDIQALFPANPFYAGFGNRINDTWAYRAINIPSCRIFTINHRGELKLGLIQSWHSSYNCLSDLVDQMFPPLHRFQNNETDFLSEYSSFNYWKEPLADISDLDHN